MKSRIGGSRDCKSRDLGITQVNNYKNVKFFGQDFINIILEAGWYVW